MSTVGAALPRVSDTAVGALWSCAQAFSDEREPALLAGVSGLAFRISLDTEVSLGSPHAYPWTEVLGRAAARLGYAYSIVHSDDPPGSALHQRAQRRAEELINRGLSEGRPTMIWGVHAPEFGVVRGKTGNCWLTSGILDEHAAPTIEPSELGRGDMPVVFALQLTERTPFDAQTDYAQMLRNIVVQAQPGQPCLSGFVTGLAAWNALRAALESGRVDPTGLGYAAGRFAEARKWAAFSVEEAMRVLSLDLSQAATAWRRSAAMLAELGRCFPFPPPPEQMVTTNVLEQSLALAEIIVQAEEEAVAHVAAALSG